VIAGSQYFYENKNVRANRVFDEEREENVNESKDENNKRDIITQQEVKQLNVTISLNQVTVMTHLLNGRLVFHQ
jgi:hypothetical protein